MMGFWLKQAASFNFGDFEDYVDVLCRLDGTTMAEGLPDRATLKLTRELSIREMLASPMLPNADVRMSLLDRILNDARIDQESIVLSDTEIDQTIEILRKAKIPLSLRAELQRVRDVCSREEAITPDADDEDAKIDSADSSTPETGTGTKE